MGFISPKLKGYKSRIMEAYNNYREKFGLESFPEVFTQTQGKKNGFVLNGKKWRTK